MKLSQTTLAIDIATNSGFAVGSPDHGVIDSWGTNLGGSDRELASMRKSRGARRCDPRFSALCKQVQDALAKHPGVSRIIFEDVEFAQSQAWAQLWASLRAALWCAAPTLEYRCVGPSTLKKAFTGSGKADKIDMGRALTENPWFAGRYRYTKGVVATETPTGWKTVYDDEVDALALLYLAATVDSGLADWPENQPVVKSKKKK
jgi:Holliday junction resolvasome RuvABC endonuclease subunit